MRIRGFSLDERGHSAFHISDAYAQARQITSIIYEGSANPASSAIQLTINQQGTKKPNATKGGSMGLTLDDQALNSTQTNPFVAVEFDIYQNPWDPPLEHAGIDINSMISVANLTWLADIKEGKLNEAWINYNASSLNLSVIFTGFNNDTSTTVIQHLSSIVDLRLYLPEFVTVGFSAATGNATAIHSISSWDFSSTLESQQDNNKTNIEDPNIAPSSKKKKSKAGLAVGLGIGGFVLIAVFGLISFYLWKKLKKGKEEEDGDFEEYMGEDFGRGGPKKYTYAELAHAANNFKDEHKLGQGGFGGVYRARFVDHAKGAQTTALAGTLGYMAPECSTTGRASKETDVYSFGIVALEIACGRKPINLKAQENEIHIVDWVWGLYGRGKILEAVDPRLSGDFEEAQIKCLMIVGIWCAHPDPKNRPSIRQAIQVLNFEAPLPNLPSSMPVPTYLEGPLNSFTAPFSISGSETSQSQNIISFSSNTNSSGFTTTTTSTTSDDVSPSLSLLYSRRN
ncbi:L-type lectin-domain containing receptor kinase IX.1 [Trifolium repens]|nr:L-type lectin-domain containing receptor kinase IX.1 [Trifolium repens]